MLTYATAKIKIPTSNELVQTVKLYSTCLQMCINTAWERKIKNNVKLHPFVYSLLRQRGLPAQLAVACIKQACGVVKKAKNKPLMKKTSVRYNFPRSASLKNNLLSISTIKGRIKIPLTIPLCYQTYFSWDISESLLRRDNKGRWFFLFTFSKEVTGASSQEHQMLGVDLGIKTLAVTSDGQFFKSSQVKQTKRKFIFLRGKLQSKGTRSSRRLLKKLSGKERRFMLWANHNISKTIVSTFNGNIIVMEDLKGIRKKHRGKKLNSWISNWSFYQLQRFIEYKAHRKGIEIVKISPAFTSQICSHCGKLGSRYKGFFSCLSCKFSLHADLNASRNLAKGISYLRQVVVNQPNISNDDTKALVVNCGGV